MFGLLDKAVDMAVNTVTAPIRMAGSAVEIAIGLTAGELRREAIESLGWEVVSNMTQSELIDWYKEL